MRKFILSAIIGVLLFISCTVFSEQAYYGANLCGYAEFKCITVGPNDTWVKLFPNVREREMIKRLNRTNVSLHYRSWIVVPTDIHNIDLLDLSPFPDTVKPLGEKLVVVNLSLQAFAAYDENGQLIRWGPVSGGRDWCDDVQRPCRTAMGEYRIINKEGPECVSTAFPVETKGGAPMPWCMYYYRGFALHGSTLPGYHASHGCIRLFPEDARWLNQNFTTIGTKIVVLD